MPSFKLIDARDLEWWARSRRAQEQLPVLVRRLIHATTTTATHIGLPAGDAVQQGGYDGVVVINETHYAVPDGKSVWEFGVDANPRGKADDEYEKRKARQPDSAIGPVDPTSTTFVFVTPRRWNAKTRWLRTRRAESFWRDVRVLDADDLEAWLEQAPPTHVWLSTLLGRRPVGADDLEAVWQDWADSTIPPLSPGLMFAGREPARDEIRSWFTSPSEVLTLGVESESPEETIALVAAALVSLPEDKRVAALARTVVVRDDNALVQLAAADEQIRIVTTFSPGDLAQRATRRGHRVLLPRSPGESVISTLKVPRLHRDDAERELKAMGLPDDRARELAGLARRSLLALRRRLAASAAISWPAWSSSEVGPSVLPIFFLDAVNADMPGDIEVLSLLAGEPAETTVAQFARLATEVDPPVRRVGNIYYLISKEDAWEALSRFITRDVLERFVTVAVGVLGSSDPAYELPPDQRWAAGIYEKKRQYTGLLMRGIADTLALFGARGVELAVAPGVSAADYAAQAVRKLFERAGREWQQWASLAPVFPSLIEAAPDAMLSAIEAGLAGPEPSPVIGLFGHDVDTMFSSSPHTYLLWALERAAWSPDYLGRTTLLLAELARRAPRGRLANTPSASLRSIFLAWMPATAASVETRLDVIDTMRRREPDAAWDLMETVLPRQHDFNMRTERPAWREWTPEREVRPTHCMLVEHAAEIVKRMLEDVGTSGPRWKELVKALDHLPMEAHGAILARLSILAREPMPADLRSAIWNALRQLVSRHRSFPDADWALAPERVDAIASVFTQFEPDDVVARDGYLFSHDTALPEGREQDINAHQQLLAVRRISAAQTWYRKLGAEEIVRVGATLELPAALGEALAESGVVPPVEEPVLLKLALEHHEFPACTLGRAYLARRFPTGGTIIAFLREFGSEWSAITRAEALLAMRPGAEAWAEVEALGDVGRAHYWQNVFVHRADDADLSRALRELVRYKRSHAAIDLAAHHLCRDSKPSAADVRHALLEAALIANDVTGYRAQSYDISTLVAFLEREAETGRIAEDDVAQLELLYLPLFWHDQCPNLLNKAMRRDPLLFVEAVCLAFRGEGEQEHEVDDTVRNRAEIAFKLLLSWRTPPGLENGVIDACQLDAWVDEARRRLAENNRAVIGDQLIGQVLSGSPAGADGAWPAEPIREIIERLKSDDLENGLHMGRFNHRGVVTRSLLSGGDMERSIQAQYEADAGKLAARWPRTAAFLRSLAATYERDAAREDIDAELRHDLDV